MNTDSDYVFDEFIDDSTRILDSIENNGASFINSRNLSLFNNAEQIAIHNTNKLSSFSTTQTRSPGAFPISQSADQHYSDPVAELEGKKNRNTAINSGANSIYHMNDALGFLTESSQRYIPLSTTPTASMSSMRLFSQSDYSNNAQQPFVSSHNHNAYDLQISYPSISHESENVSYNHHSATSKVSSSFSNPQKSEISSTPILIAGSSQVNIPKRTPKVDSSISSQSLPYKESVNEHASYLDFYPSSHRMKSPYQQTQSQYQFSYQQQYQAQGQEQHQQTQHIDIFHPTSMQQQAVGHQYTMAATSENSFNNLSTLPAAYARSVNTPYSLTPASASPNPSLSGSLTESSDNISKRERNRLAAERCRRKKQENVDQLSVENQSLRQERDELKRINQLLEQKSDYLFKICELHGILDPYSGLK